jgi:hypothetical protein
MRKSALLKETSSSQIHQHLTYEFFVQMLFRQLFSSYMYIEKATKMMVV